MTLVRKLALKISDAVVAFASPGSKEWAEGLTSEVAFIEGDWTALGWAIGSIRILLDYREAPIRSISDLNIAARRFAELKRNSQARWIWMFVWVLILSDRFFRSATSIGHAGWSMAALGFLLMAVINLVEWRSRREVPEDDDAAGCLQFYVAEMERIYKPYSSARLWTTVGAITLVCAGLILGYQDTHSAHAMLAASLLWVGVILMMLKLWQNNRRRLEQIEAVLSEKS